MPRDIKVTGKNESRHYAKDEWGRSSKQTEGRKRYVVNNNDSYFSIAAQQLGGGASQSQVAAYAQALANANNGLALRSGMGIKIPKVTVGVNARPTTAFMAVANGQVDQYGNPLASFDPTGNTQYGGVGSAITTTSPYVKPQNFNDVQPTTPNYTGLASVDPYAGLGNDNAPMANPYAGLGNDKVATRPGYTGKPYVSPDAAYANAQQNLFSGIARGVGSLVSGIANSGAGALVGGVPTPNTQSLDTTTKPTLANPQTNTPVVSAPKPQTSRATIEDAARRQAVIQSSEIALTYAADASGLPRPTYNANAARYAGMYETLLSGGYAEDGNGNLVTSQANLDALISAAGAGTTTSGGNSNGTVYTSYNLSYYGNPSGITRIPRGGGAGGNGGGGGGNLGSSYNPYQSYDGAVSGLINWRMDFA